MLAPYDRQPREAPRLGESPKSVCVCGFTGQRAGHSRELNGAGHLHNRPRNRDVAATGEEIPSDTGLRSEDSSSAAATSWSIVPNWRMSAAGLLADPLTPVGHQRCLPAIEQTPRTHERGHRTERDSGIVNHFGVAHALGRGIQHANGLSVVHELEEVAVTCHDEHGIRRLTC